MRPSLNADQVACATHQCSSISRVRQGSAAALEVDTYTVRAKSLLVAMVGFSLGGLLFWRPRGYRVWRKRDECDVEWLRSARTRAGDVANNRQRERGSGRLPGRTTSPGWERPRPCYWPPFITLIPSFLPSHRWSAVDGPGYISVHFLVMVRNLDASILSWTCHNQFCKQRGFALLEPVCRTGFKSPWTSIFPRSTQALQRK